MATRYSGAAIAMPLPADVDNTNYLQQEILQSIATDTSIPAACLRALGRSMELIDHEAYYAQGKNAYGLPVVSVSETQIADNNMHTTGTIVSGDAPETLSLYPMVPVRLNATSLTVSDSDAPYVKARDILEVAQLDAGALIESINANPDIKEVDDCSIAFSVPATTDVSDHLRHLCIFYKKVLNKFETYHLPGVIGNYNGELAKQQPKAPPTAPPSFVVPDDLPTDLKDKWYLLESQKILNPTDMVAYYNSQDRTSFLNISQGDFKISLGFGYITHRVVSGVKCPVGTAIRTLDIQEPKQVLDSVVGNSGPTFIFRDQDRSKITIYNQIDSDNYEEVVVLGLLHYSLIHSKVRIKPIYLKDAVMDAKYAEGFYIPLEYHSILASVPDNDTGRLHKKRVSKLFSSTRTLNINALKRSKIKWYESSLFGVLIKVVAIIISVYTLNPYIAAAAVSVGAFAIFVLELILTAIVFKIIAEEAVKLLGLENALLAALILTVASAVLGASGTYFDISVLGTPELLQSVSAVTGQLGDAVLSAANAAVGDAMDTLGDARDAFNEKAAGVQGEIDRVNKEIYDSMQSNVNPWNYIGTPSFNFNETPDIFFARTLNESPGELVYTAIDNYTELALTLPDPII